MESEQFSLSLPPSPGPLTCKFSGPVFSRLSCTQPRGTGSRFRWSRWRMFYILRSLSLRTLEPRHLTFSRLLWPILNSWTFFACVTEKLSLDCESQSSKLDERFLLSSCSCPAMRKLPFFPDMLHEISRSWKRPFSSRLTNAAAANFTNLVGSVERGIRRSPGDQVHARCALLANFCPLVEVPPSPSVQAV